ncbi:Protein FAR1-RELATED SEQUENCE 5 [Glycine max]|nr:Protein FAR1-RELATED SEQUENCE 5 [Glycine max]
MVVGSCRRGSGQEWGAKKSKGKGRGCSDLVSRQKRNFPRVSNVNNTIGSENSSVCGEGEGALRWSAAANEMDEDEWMYEIMSKQADMDYENEEACGANESHVDCSDAFNTSQVFECREDVLRWARSVAHENGFVAMILRSDTNTGSRGRTIFVLIGCERSGEYRCRKKEFIRRDTETRKCGCPFKLCCKPVVGGEGWMVKLICVVHNHELAKSLVGHPYAERLTKAEKTLIADMTKSMVKPKNILLTLKEHNVNSCTTIKHIYNARSAFCSSIRGSDLEMQHLMNLLERDQYIHWHRIKDEDVVRDIFWCHPDVVKLVNTCNLVFLINNTYKTNRYRLPLLDFVEVTPTGMTFSVGFAYVEVFECREDVLRWARSVAHENEFVAVILRSDTNTGSRGRTTFMLIGCERSDEYRCRKKEFIRRDIGTRKCGCPFKLCCKPMVGGEGWMVKLICVVHNHELAKSLIGHPYAERLTKTEKTLIADMTKSMVKPRNILLTLKEHNANSCTTIKQIYNARSAFRSSIRGSDLEMQHLMKLFERDQYIHWHRIKDEDVVRDIFWCHPDAVKLVKHHTEIKASFETSTHVVGHVFKKTLYRRLLGMVSRRLSFSNQGLSEREVSIKEVMETISKRFEELDICGKFTLKTKLWEIAYPDQNSMCPPPAKVNTKGAPKKAMSRNPRSTKRDPSYWEYVDAFESMQNSNSSVRRTASSSEQSNRRTMMPMLDQFQPFMHDFIYKIVDVKADGNCGYRSVAGLLGMGQDSWSVVHNHLLKELTKFSEDYIKLFGDTERFEELRMPLLVDGLTKVTTDKWMDIIDMGHVIASRYNVYLKERCPLPPITLLWSSNCHPQAKPWPNSYISRMQHYKSFVMFKRDYVNINDD